MGVSIIIFHLSFLNDMFIDLRNKRFNKSESSYSKYYTVLYISILWNQVVANLLLEKKIGVYKGLK